MQCFEDGLDDVARPSHHITIPESEDSIAASPKEGVSMKVLRSLIEMLTSIQLNDDLGFDTDKVADIDTNWVLSPELVAVPLPSPQMTPKATFSLSLVLSQLASEVNHLSR
jgi:hypothetical protein